MGWWSEYDTKKDLNCKKCFLSLFQHAEIDKPNADKFRSKLITPMTALKVLKYLLIGIGVALFVVVIGLLAYGRHKVYYRNLTLIILFVII